MKISNDINFWEKIPIIGSLIGAKEILENGAALIGLAATSKTKLIGKKILQHEEAVHQASSRLFRGLVALVPFLGGGALEVYDRSVRKTEVPKGQVPFPSFLEGMKLEKKGDIAARCQHLRDPELIQNLFDLNKIGKRLNHQDLKRAYTEILGNLKEAINKIPQTHDKKELKLLKKAWIECLAKNYEILAKLNFNPENLQLLGFGLLENIWVEALRSDVPNNSLLEITRADPDFSDISLAAAFSVFAKYPQLKGHPYKDNLGHLKDSHYTGIKLSRSPHLASSLACQSLANMVAANRKDFFRLDLTKNSLTTERAIELAAGLKFNSHLYFLNLSENPIGNGGAMALCKSLHLAVSHPTADMRHLDKPFFHLELSDCQIGDESIQAILQLVTDAKHEFILGLRGNNFTPAGKQQLREAVNEYNKSRTDNKIMLDIEIGTRSIS